MERMVAPAILALALSASPQSAAAPDAVQGDSYVARIRDLLARRAPVLKISTPEPTYKVEIIQHPYFTTVPFVWTFAGGGVPTAQRQTDASSPLISVGVPIGGGGDAGIGAAFRALKSKFDERAARDEVGRAVAEFCATHAC
jgi:hypothetical protein